MKIFKNNASKVILMIFVLLNIFNLVVFAGVNPSREEVEFMIERVAEKRAIPAILLKAIARVESCYEHFNSDGSTKITGTSIGLMQVNNQNGGYDSERLRNDIEYNIEAGADVLLNKWSMSSYNNVSSVGNMDPNILENWYFALWAYNGWAQSNNPNMTKNYAKKYTYQQLVYDVAEKEYNKKINNIDFSYLPATGKPSRSLVVPTPSNTNSGDIILYEKDDYVRTDGIRAKYMLRDEPSGKYIHELCVNQLAIVTDGPVLQNGYYWYKVYVDDNTEGWIERNWILRTGDTEYGKYIFKDISFHWARKTIMDLYRKNIVSESEFFKPNNYITTEEFSVMLSKTLDYTNIHDTENAKSSENSTDSAKEPTEIPKHSILFEDMENIHPWAVEYMEDIYDFGLAKYEDLQNPLGSLTRIDAALMVAKLFEVSKDFDSLNIKNIFSDTDNLTEEEISAVKTVYTNGIMFGKYSGIFCPSEFLTRAEAAVIMDKIVNKTEN